MEFLDRLEEAAAADRVEELVPDANELNLLPGRTTFALGDQLGDQRHLMHGGQPRPFWSHAFLNGPR